MAGIAAIDLQLLEGSITLFGMFSKHSFGPVGVTNTNLGVGGCPI